MRTLAAGLRHVADEASGELRSGLEPVLAQLEGLSLASEDDPHASLPSKGATTSRTFVVGPDDTAASMGHPDPSVQVLGTPRIGLWFEIAGSDLMPEPDGEVQHVGVGLIVHHIGSAAVGEEVEVTVTVTEVAGRAIVFSCRATRGEELVATGTHHRVVVSADR